MTEECIPYGDSILYYSKTGSGEVPILLFHGFAQSHLAFRSWTPKLEHTYTLYSFDLYFHGRSHWPEAKALEKTDWKEVLLLFLAKERIDGFALAGFSLGGKFVLATIELFPDRVKNVLLIAPDGIKTSIWYSLATYPTVLRHLFKSMILKPGRFHTLVKILRRLHVVDKGLLRFAESQMDTEEKRRRVYCSWVVFRHFSFDLNKLAHIINEYNIPVTVLAGRYDKVIRAANMKPFLQKLAKQRLEIAEAGHNDLIARGADLT